jgi:PLD-like domain
MRYLVPLFVLLFAIPTHAEDIGNNTVCFTPGPQDCAAVAVVEINKAERTLEIEQFQLTEPRVGQAIIDAKNRDVAVRLIVDKKAPTEKNGQTSSIAVASSPAFVMCLRRFRRLGLGVVRLRQLPTCHALQYAVGVLDGVHVSVVAFDHVNGSSHLLGKEIHVG